LSTDLIRESDAKKKTAIKTRSSTLKKRSENVLRMSNTEVVIDLAIFDALSVNAATNAVRATVHRQSVWSMFTSATGYHPPSGY